MTLPTDFADLIAIARADELDGIHRKILDRVDDLGGKPAFDLLKALAARRLALAEERRMAVVEETDLEWQDDA